MFLSETSEKSPDDSAASEDLTSGVYFSTVWEWQDTK